MTIFLYLHVCCWVNREFWWHENFLILISVLSQFLIRGATCEMFILDGSFLKEFWTVSMDHGNLFLQRLFMSFRLTNNFNFHSLPLLCFFAIKTSRCYSIIPASPVWSCRSMSIEIYAIFSDTLFILLTVRVLWYHIVTGYYILCSFKFQC